MAVDVGVTTLATTVPFAAPLLLIGAAMVMVPVFKRLGLGSVLGYLTAGVLIGPAALGFFSDPAEIMHFAELGIVLFLFLIGLSLKPSRLWAMRRDIFGLGLAQIVVTAAAISFFGIQLFDLPWKGALVAGVGLALSSTALVMQMLEEKGETQSLFGRKAFAILLMQDLAIVPLLALLPLLSPQPVHGGPSLGVAVAEVVGAVAVVVGVGRWLLNPLFRLLAASGAREIMTAAALFVVIGAASLVSLVGLSMATGAFLAGVMLAESNFRNQLQVDIEPFRGLLLGLFFMSVGMTIDLKVVAEYWDQMLEGLIALVIVKVLALWLVARLARVPHADAVRVAFFLAQGGEFGFVLYSAAVGSGAMPAVLGSVLITVVTLSMALTPLVVAAVPLFLPKKPEKKIEEDYSDATGSVVLIGFGRFGQILSQLLLAEGIDLTIIDKDPSMIRSAGRFGFRIFYGDGTRLDVLRSVGADRAKVVVVATEQTAVTNRIVELVKAEFPLAKVFARAFDRAHALTLLDRNVDFQVRETYESAILAGRETLLALGLDAERARTIEEDVRRRDLARLALEQTDGPTAGAALMHQRPPPRPEPLNPPRRTARPLSDATEEVAHEDPEPATASGI
ncbi:monovalent cation:proton antiporter-2 (CPA2) family protein [Pinisolibacter aquiterrae]|uniref:monovalent cation:proton antiporter-2 (CPA2) family protein n=1 Tax=Pinisolibacter aquiterrae TaxID=2815579 RepID=UPI001C3CD471|nr:monovalent cation:proton antiporter-2 (CPA2) family protein [Pinisolibacter aquiterrae]MBV5266673.1 cation:proton antiporter [Pinisolibacter aquiterrae]MCC8235014.1 monovalent cation:proton antiporter-2 (CPA2) family protein [Pinisolibacter aquiterrae]